MSGTGHRKAFPQVVWCEDGQSPFETMEGLTRREWMAGQVAAGYLATMPKVENLPDEDIQRIKSAECQADQVRVAIEIRARDVVSLTDAILAELDRTGGAS